MTPIAFMIMIGTVTLVVIMGLLFVRWEGKYATNYHQKAERKRRLEFAKKQVEAKDNKEVKKDIEIMTK